MICFEKLTNNINFFEFASGCRSSRFGRPNKLILTQNETSIHLNDFQCNRTNNQNAKYQLNFKSDVQCHRFRRCQVQAISPSVSNGEPAVNRQPGFRRALVEQSRALYFSNGVFPSVRCIQIKILKF